MYLRLSVLEGQPPRLYRTTREIRRDMTEIANQIHDVEDMLSVHNLLIEMIPQWAEESPERWIPELQETLAEAEESLLRLRRLKEALEELSDELKEVGCILKR